MEFKTKKRRISRTRIFVLLAPGVEEPLWELADLVGELEDTGHWARTLSIYPDELAKWMEEKRIVTRSTPGGYYRGSRYPGFRKAIHKLVDAESKSR